MINNNKYRSDYEVLVIASSEKIKAFSSITKLRNVASKIVNTCTAKPLAVVVLGILRTLSWLPLTRNGLQKCPNPKI